MTTAPARLLVAELRKGPANVVELSERLAYPVRRILPLISAVRAAGHDVRCVRQDAGELSTFELRDE